MPYRSLGKLRYSPELIGGKQERWWVVVDCDETIPPYYRELYRLHHHGARELVAPAWKSHITIVRNEEPPEQFKSLWGKYEGWEVPFILFPPCETDGRYVWVPVWCSFGYEMRKELGLSYFPEIDTHLSIGHTGIREEKCESSDFSLLV